MIPDLYDLYDLYHLAHVAGWKLYNLHDLRALSDFGGVDFVRYKSGTTCRNTLGIQMI